MPTKLETLKARLDKRTQDITDIKKSIETEELAEMQAEEFALKLVEVQEKVSTAVKDILDKAEITLPAGKSITITSTDAGELSVSTLAQKPARKTTGGGGVARATLEIPADHPNSELAGKKMSWAQVADAVGISYGGGSAHKAVFTQNKDLHDTIPHENCPYV